MDPGNAFTPAFDYMVQLLFRPFQWKKWLALGFASLMAYPGSGGFNFNIPSGGSPGTGKNPYGIPPELSQAGQWMLHHIALIILGVAALFALGLVLGWVASVFRFVHIEQIVRNTGAIKEPFSRFKREGTSYFLWLIGFGLVALAVMGLVVGLVLLIIVATPDNPAPAIKILVALLGAFVFLLLIVAISVIAVFAEDFVVPVMFARRVGVLEAWSIVRPILSANKGPSVLYILFVIVIAIGTAIVGLFAGLAVLIAFLIPGGVLAGIGYLIYNAAGRNWLSHVFLLYAIPAGALLFAALAYAANCVMQPAVVFRRAYSLTVLGRADPALALLPGGAPLPPREHEGES